MSDRKRGRGDAPDDLSRDEWVNYCWSDMKRRWERKEPVFVEDYLPANHLHAVNPDAKIDLIYAEYILRKEHGQQPDYAEYNERFPELAERLTRQFALDDALSSEILHEFDSTYISDPGTPPTEDLVPPERIGKYVVVGQIGEGGQAEIYRAVHPGLNKEVVLKLAKNTPELPATQRRHLESEARILASIEHPNLARVYDLDCYQDRPFLVMESIKGRTLEQYVRQEKPTPRDCAQTLGKIARGLSAVHRRNIVHLDIKPGNILIDEQNEPRIIDFGLAHFSGAWQEEIREESNVRGTLYFMPPEQAMGHTAQMDYRSDIFALGGLLYFLLTQRPPYPKCKFAELLERVRSCEWDQESLFHGNIPPALRDACLRAMHEDPNERYSSAEDFAKTMDQFVRGPLRFWKHAVGVTVVVLLACVAFAVARDWPFSSRPIGDNTASGGTSRKVVADQELHDPFVFKSSLAIDVWESGRFLRLSDITPIRNDDELRISAEIPAGMSFSLALLTSEGHLEELLHGKTTQEPMRVQYPKLGKTVPIVGPPGTEVVILCATRSGPWRLKQLQSAWEMSGRLPVLPEHSVLRADSNGVTVEQRGRGFGAPVDRADPESVVQQALEQLRRQLKDRVEHFEALAFSHQL